MPTLKTTDGLQYTFSAGSVSMVTDHDTLTFQATTCVYGIANTYLRIAEDADAFITRIKVKSKLAKLTRPTGWAIWVNGSSVSTVTTPSEGEYVEGVKSVVRIDGLYLGVKEAPDDAIKAINAHGGDL